LIEDTWGNGFGTEAIQLVTDWATKNTDLHLIYAHTHPENIASQRVLQKNNFETEGTLKDRMFYQEKFYSIKMLSKVLH
jgi:RimJ/RimL family protein N-acetyltransferase